MSGTMRIVRRVVAVLPGQLKRLLGQIYYTGLQYRDPVLRKSAKRLRELRGMYSGKRCFIMGNGPSLKQTPLEKLENEFVWGFNRCYLLFNQTKWRPTFYTAVDTLVVPDIASELNKLTKDLPETQFFFPFSFYFNNTLTNRSNIVWFRQIGMNASKGSEGFFSSNAAKCLRVPHTVAITALQLSVYMGFNPIYLVGCDTSYTIPEGLEGKGEVVDPGTGEKISGFEIISTSDNDPNHFDPRYFGAGSKWHAPNVRGMIFGYEIAKRVCDTQGVKVFNATIGGMLEVFPRVNYNELF